MKPKLPITVLFLLLFLPLTTPLRPISPSSPCKTRHDPIHLRSDQITVLINGYSSSRLHLLLPIATTYASNPIVAAVLILWSNPTTPSETLTNFSLNLSLYSSSAPISILRHPTASLNSRFLPRSLITSRAVVICDDDIEIDPQSFNFAFKIWQLNQDRLIGFFSRSHDLDIPTKTWMYNIHPNKYSIILTKFMILKTEYLHKYSCTNGHNQGAEGLKWVEMRKMVDEKMNCEDILMNFLVADESNSGPILVEAKSLRDFGDARNDEERERVKEVGLSSRRSEHRKRRGECIREFHKVLGRMPLKYNYGKVVNSVGEQGLCKKGGKLVFCDQQKFGTVARGDADCHFWHRNLGIERRLHELANKRRISVTGASKLLANILYSYRGVGLTLGTMIARWDETGPGLYYIDSEGGRLKEARFSV